MQTLAVKYPTVKFIKAISTTCIPNFPDKNLPSIFIYFEGDIRKQYIGSVSLRGPNITLEGILYIQQLYRFYNANIFTEFEYLLGQSGAINTDITEDPRPTVRDKLFADLADTNCNNDWQ